MQNLSQSSVLDVWHICGTYHRTICLKFGIIGPFHDELKELATEGLLEMKPSDLPGHVRYWITEKGRETVIHEKEL